jgi:hypothetical protein
VRNIRHAHLLENELLEVIVRFLAPHAVGVANHRGDGVDDRLRDGASNFGWKPAEVVPLLRAEGDRVIAVVVNPVAGPDLMILAVSWRNVISFWLWEEPPNRRFRGHRVAKSAFSDSPESLRNRASRLNWPRKNIRVTRGKVALRREIQRRSQRHREVTLYGEGGEIAANDLENQELTMLALHLLQICLVLPLI